MTSIIQETRFFHDNRNRNSRIGAFSRFDLYSGKTQTAGEREIDVCIEKIPVFIKSGAVIPMRGERAELSAAFESDKAIRFLVLTPPEEKTVTEVYYDKDKPATV